MNLKATYCLALLALVAVAANAQSTTPTAKSPPPSAFDNWANEVKKPVDWFSWGGDIRVRDEYLPNSVTLSEDVPLAEQNVIRFRGRVWGTATLVTNLTLNARVSAEPRYFTEDAGYGQRRGLDGMDWRYGIVDLANLKWANAFDQPLTITAGRQDILLGDFYDWWLVADGTPGDGSWTMFLDSVRLTYDAKPIKTKFDLIFIYQEPLPDDTIPTIGSAQYKGTDHPLTEQREKGLVLYASNKSIQNTTVDAYFIYKGDDQVTFSRGGSAWTPGDNADIYTLGGKITGTPSPHWQYSIEGAYQFGEKEDWINDGANYTRTWAERDIAAYGGKAKLTYLAKDKHNHQFFLSGEYLSGDDRDTDGKDEMFDILWGRWPRWSELYIYSYAGETGGKIAQMNNLIRFGPGWSCEPIKGMSFSAAYNAMFAPEDAPSRAVVPRFSNDGSFRGHQLQAVLKHKFNNHWQVHLWAEFVWQGDYYAQNDLMTFIRPQIEFTF